MKNKDLSLTLTLMGFLMLPLAVRELNADFVSFTSQSFECGLKRLAALKQGNYSVLKTLALSENGKPLKNLYLEVPLAHSDDGRTVEYGQLRDAPENPNKFIILASHDIFSSQILQSCGIPEKMIYAASARLISVLEETQLKDAHTLVTANRTGRRM